MLSNKELILRFYSAFQEKDFKTMQSLYAEPATFRDAVFINLNSKEVQAMWQMLIEKGKDLQISFENVQETKVGGSAVWNAIYTFSLTGNKVVNRIYADFIIKDGLITVHTDRFDFYKWAKQAFGLRGFLLGRFGFFKKAVQEKASKNLQFFMQK